MRNKYLEICKQIKQEKAHFTNLLLSLMQMFTYTGLPDAWRFPQDIERILCLCGRIGFAKKDGQYYYFPMSWTGNVSWDGRGKDYMGVVIGNNTEFTIPAEEGAWGYNNSLGYSDTELKRYADIFAQVDLSIIRNIQFARLNPILAARNDTIKAKLQELMCDIMDGKLTTVVNENLMRDFEQKAMEVHNITDVKDIDKLQYLSRFYEDLERRFFNLYGVPIQIVNKMAQTNNSEIHAHDKQAAILALDRLKCRKEMCKRLSKYFEMEITVNFSEPWQWIIEEQKEQEEIDNDNIKGMDNTANGGTENNNPAEQASDNTGDVGV